MPEASQRIANQLEIPVEHEQRKMGDEPVQFIRPGVEHHPVYRQDSPEVDPYERLLAGLEVVRLFEGGFGVVVHRPFVKLMVSLYGPLGPESAPAESGGIQGDVAPGLQEYRGNAALLDVEDLPPAAETRKCIRPGQMDDIDPVRKRFVGLRADAVHRQAVSLLRREKTQGGERNPEMPGKSRRHSRSHRRPPLYTVEVPICISRQC